MSNRQSLTGKVIWITGASSGIGTALAHELAKRKAKLALTARRIGVLEDLVKELRGLGAEAISVPADVQDSTALASAVKKIEETLGPVDILIANAGTHVFSKPEQFDSKEYLNLMDINLGGILRAIEAVLPSMQKRGVGHIVGMASLAGYRGLPRAAAYGASKAAIIHFLESARFHLERINIPITIVCPGFVRTPLTDKNDFKMPFLVTPEKAAVLICNGIEKQKKEISFPIPFNWFLKLTRIIPYPLYEFLTKKLWQRMNGSR